MKALLNLILSSFRRLTTALTTPFRLFVVKIIRMFNINVLSSKLVAPLTKKVKQLISLKPQSKKDYFTFGRYFIYKKLFVALIIVVCAGIFLYFQMFAPKLPAKTMGTESVETTVSYNYDDMSIRDFTGVANIRASDGTIVYTGDIDKGVCSGSGKLWEINGKLVYEGSFAHNKYNGKGISYFPSGNKHYEGEYADNLYSGSGSIYADDGTLIYSGEFKEGVYSGSGMLYSESATLAYEGNFSGGKYHGTGKSYSTTGLPLYEGEFYEGIPQGQGTLYSGKGKQIYNGFVRAGNINIDTLIGASLEDVQGMFSETPQIFYSDNSCVFVFEQAGVILTGECKVKVDTWERPIENVPDGENEFYFPPDGVGEMPNNDGQLVSVDMSKKTSFHGLSLVNSWFVGDEDTSSGSSNGSSDTSSDENSSNGGNTSSVDGDSQNSASSDSASSMPDFVQKQHKLYFEVDKNVWQSEEELDKSKITIRKITIFNTLPTIQPKTEGVEYTDGAPATIEDCVAIDFIRTAKPTAFSNILFEMDKQNKSFVYLMNINFAGKIDRKVLSEEDLTYKYCYDINNPEVLMYYSVEN